MSKILNENLIPRQLLTLGGIAIVMPSLASFHPWIAGCCAFLAMTIVVAIAALRGDFRATLIVFGVAASLSSGVCWFAGAELSLSLTLLINMFGIFTLGFLGSTVCTASRNQLDKINDLKSQQFELVRKVYDYDRTSTLSGEFPAFAGNRPAVSGLRLQEKSDSALGQKPPEGTDNSQSPVVDPDVFDFAMLLLSMQQIGHRLSSELKLETLVSEILNTAKEALRCRRAELHLWNARDSRFDNAVQSEVAVLRNSVRAVLNQATPSLDSFTWVKEQRRILTRRDVVSGKVDAPALSGGALPTAIAPLLVGDDLVGVLVIDDAEEEGPTFLRMLHILANHCALSLKNSQLFCTIQEMARRDGLTGLLNHAPFLEELERLIDESIADDRPLTLVMGDLDHFKDFNDSFGHQAGDRVLQEVARWWQAIMPDHAILGRYGGEEFICALPGETLSRGVELAEILRSSLVAHPVSFNGNQLQVTSSFGVAELGNPAPNAARLIRLADKALYRAKNAGRDRVESHDPSQPEIAAMAESIQFSLQ